MKRPFGVAVVVAALTGVLVAVSTVVAANAKDPRLTRAFYVDPQSAAAQALTRGEPVKKLARTPQAIWLTESSAPTATATRVVKDHLARARKKKRTAVFVVYAVPGRDCGSYSGGGLPPAEYRSWVAAVAAGLKGSKAMVVLEPDAVATLDQCEGQGNRAQLLSSAAKKLTRAGAWVYLDGGHSEWIAVNEMADRLVRSGAQHARGFATNVSNHRTTSQEKAYAARLRTALSARGVKKRHYVIDTSRNGGPASIGTDWCNNLKSRVGAAPRVVNKAGLDALLWVKRPGESDGYCNGGPAAGTWWPAAAKTLLGKV